jgi:hypothetical protein
MMCNIFFSFEESTKLKLAIWAIEMKSQKLKNITQQLMVEDEREK